MWEPEITPDTAARICTLARSHGITSAGDLRAILTRLAREERERRALQQRWERAAGRRRVA